MERVSFCTTRNQGIKESRNKQVRYNFRLLYLERALLVTNHFQLAYQSPCSLDDAIIDFLHDGRVRKFILQKMQNYVQLVDRSASVSSIK